MAESLHVVAGILRDTLGRVLIAQRLAGTHMAGRWEFPGGKLEHAEQRRKGLERELNEELGIVVTECSPLMRLRHSYPDREVLLDFWNVQRYQGEPTGVVGQALRWLHISDLPNADLLEADRPVVDALRLPHCYAITADPPVDLAVFANQIEAVVASGVSLIQLRAPGIDRARLQLLSVAAVQAARGASVLINGDPAVTIPLALATGAAGVHLPSRYLAQLANTPKPAGILIGASCHDQAELRLAAAGGAHFAVLGPVLPTATHPQATGLGWDGFAELVDLATLPVYALGGLGPGDIERARALGAQGVAGIRAFFDD